MGRHARRDCTSRDQQDHYQFSWYDQWTHGRCPESRRCGSRSSGELHRRRYLRSAGWWWRSELSRVWERKNVHFLALWDRGVYAYRLHLRRCKKRIGRLTTNKQTPWKTTLKNVLRSSRNCSPRQPSLRELVRLLSKSTLQSKTFRGWWLRIRMQIRFFSFRSTHSCAGASVMHCVSLSMTAVIICMLMISPSVPDSTSIKMGRLSRYSTVWKSKMTKNNPLTNPVLSGIRAYTQTF